MDARFKNSLTKGYEPLIPTLELPDLKNRHVLAVAVHVKAKYIVTFNLDDFPNDALQPYGIEALSPDAFVWRLIQIDPKRIIQAVKNHRLSLTRPSKTLDAYLATLEKRGLFKTVVFLREHREEI